ARADSTPRQGWWGKRNSLRDGGARGLAKPEPATATPGDPPDRRLPANERRGRAPGAEKNVRAVKGPRPATTAAAGRDRGRDQGLGAWVLPLPRSSAPQSAAAMLGIESASCSGCKGEKSVEGR